MAHLRNGNLQQPTLDFTTEIDMRSGAATLSRLFDEEKPSLQFAIRWMGNPREMTILYPNNNIALFIKPSLDQEPRNFFKKEIQL